VLRARHWPVSHSVSQFSVTSPENTIRFNWSNESTEMGSAAMVERRE
jgi:hypothetical protein